ncbi:putative phage large terminase subunit GpP, partial [Escherichia coli p0305293.13]
ATGLGVGVFQLVRSFYPAARDIRYTPEMKTAMVLKQKTYRRGCLEYDVSATDITSSLWLSARPYQQRTQRHL